VNAQATLSSRAGRTRRALVGGAWALAWTLAWGGALALFARRAEAAPLTLAVSSGPVSLPVYVAEAKGFFKEGARGRECIRWLADGHVDMATAAKLLVVTGAAAHRDLAIVATISASSYQIKVVARRSAQIAEAPQVSGKRVGTVPDSSAQYFLDDWLIFNDIDPATVKLIGLAPDELVAALQAHALDAIAIWEPIASTAALSLAGDAVVFASPRVYTQHFNLVAARPALAHRDADVARVLRALLRAQRAIQAEPGVASSLLAERLHMGPTQATAMMESQDYRVRLDQSLVIAMQSQARWAARRAGDGRTGVDVLVAIDAAPLQRIDATAVGLVR
jgi:ABC-type nitrate/sulfonate/bicarbonate transport system substrate-binding protein